MARPRLPNPLEILDGFAAAFTHYFRFTQEGFEHLRTPGPKLIVGYHGRPIAWDMVILASQLRRELRLKEPPVSIVHEFLLNNRMTGPFFRAIGALPTVSAVEKTPSVVGRHIIVTPGGVAEAARSSLDRHRVSWAGPRRYLDLALELDIPIVPVGTYGVDHTYAFLNDGQALAEWVSRFTHPSVRKLALSVAVGPFGLMPFSPPFPARFHQVIGAPIRVADFAKSRTDKEGLSRAHDAVTRAVQESLDSARRWVLKIATETVEGQDVGAA